VYVSVRGRAAIERLRAEDGLTLIELLVATAAGLVVAAAAMAILVTSVHFSNNSADRVDANQQGSVAMEKIVQALNSSCVNGIINGAGVSPIVGSPTTSSVTGGQSVSGGTSTPSSGDSITFVSSLADSASLTPNEVVIALTGGSIVETIYHATSGVPPSWTFSTSPFSTVTLLQHAANPTGSSAIFTYYGYDPTTGTLSSTPYATGSGLSYTNAATTAEVGISFNAEPGDNSQSPGASVDVADSVVLRLTPVSNNVPATGSTIPTPCS
jgi:prepilin-type N-terminal cleavage/methylation domain-containing protein